MFIECPLYEQHVYQVPVDQATVDRVENEREINVRFCGDRQFRKIHGGKDAYEHG